MADEQTPPNANDRPNRRSLSSSISIAKNLSLKLLKQPNQIAF
jgi:hypothetical protein